MAKGNSSPTVANATVGGSFSTRQLTWLGDDIGLSNGEDAAVWQSHEEQISILLERRHG